ncbi:MAG TPA: hypothetical protein VF426_08615 [Marmoricola sp.]
MGTGFDGRGRTCLHVGTPKSGTTYLQERLRLNAAGLEQQGVHYPVAPSWALSSVDPSFRAALDLLGQQWGVPASQIRGQWRRVSGAARRHDGVTVLSHEVLAGATPDVVRRALDDLAGQEVHVVLTVRDLSRTLPGAWQESIKQGRTWTFERFLARSRQGRTWFSRALDPVRVLSRWGEALPPERVHVVVTPAGAAPRELLWERFAQAAGLAPSAAPVVPTADNASLGAAEAHLLRLVNCRLVDGPAGSAHRGPREQFVVNDVLVPRLRNATVSAAPVLLPPDAHEWVSTTTSEWIEWIETHGVDVIGDLDELRPKPTDPSRWVDPDGPVDPPARHAAREMAEMVAEALARPEPLRQRVRRRRARLVAERRQ